MSSSLEEEAEEGHVRLLPLYHNCECVFIRICLDLSCGSDCVYVIYVSVCVCVVVQSCLKFNSPSYNSICIWRISEYRECEVCRCQCG